MAEILDAGTFLKMSNQWPIIDVRSPAEFEKGHIPGAYNIPLFTNEERAEVGTLYKQQGREAAIMHGLKLVGPKLVWYVQECKKIAVSNQVLVHCWRGGMRSSSFAWFCETADLKVGLLEGGYKAYRHFIRHSFTKANKLIVIGGMTGTGKTEILEALHLMGEQVVDLEGLASHKGSAFGFIGQKPQPTTEQFENDTALVWLTFDMQRTIWIEDESLKIGTVTNNDELYSLMRSSPLLVLKLSREFRIDRLERDYCIVPADVLIAVVKRIERRLGGDRAKSCCTFFDEGDYRNAIDILLDYYDKGYQYGMSKRDQNSLQFVELSSGDPHQAAQTIVSFASTNL